MKKTWDRAAMRFSSARYVPRLRKLDVEFENGDHFLVPAESVMPMPNHAPSTRLASRGANGAALLSPPLWAKLRIGDTGDVLEVPTLDTVIEIPWDRIRSIADPAFRAHLAAQAAKQARRIGNRVRTMRLEGGLTRVALAAKVEVTRQVIAELEAGKIEADIDLIQHIAVALGRRLRDFSEA
jgi:DNA-binding XRE family transcriptional regulator